MVDGPASFGRLIHWILQAHVAHEGLLGSQVLDQAGLLGTVDQRTHGLPFGSQRADDSPAGLACSSGDEYHANLQYRSEVLLTVGLIMENSRYAAKSQPPGSHAGAGDCHATREASDNWEGLDS